jgi:hypothetical protein
LVVGGVAVIQRDKHATLWCQRNRMIVETAAGWLEPKVLGRFHGSDSWGDFRTPSAGHGGRQRSLIAGWFAGTIPTCGIVGLELRRRSLARSPRYRRPIGDHGATSTRGRLAEPDTEQAAGYGTAPL